MCCNIFMERKFDLDSIFTWAFMGSLESVVIAVLRASLDFYGGGPSSSGWVASLCLMTKKQRVSNSLVFSNLRIICLLSA